MPSEVERWTDPLTEFYVTSSGFRACSKFLIPRETNKRLAQAHSTGQGLASGRFCREENRIQQSFSTPCHAKPVPPSLAPAPIPNPTINSSLRSLVSLDSLDVIFSFMIFEAQVFIFWNGLVLLLCLWIAF